MFDASLLGLVLLGTWLTSTYWFCLIVGGGLLVVAAVGGHGSDADVDVDTDFDADFSADVHADFSSDVHADADTDVDLGAAHAGHAADAHDGALALSKWFSVRFVVFTVATFGVVGVVLTHLSTIGQNATLAISIIAGLAVGQAVHRLFRLIKATSGDSAPRPGDYVSKLARVTIAIVHPDKGEVALHVRGSERFVPAVAEGERQKFDSGEEVVVIAYRGGVAQVVSREEFERRYRSR